MGLLKRDGIYYAEFYDASRNPNRKRYSLKTKNRRCAQAFLKRLEDGIDNRSFDPWRQSPREFERPNEEAFGLIPWSSCIQLFLDSRRSVGRSPETIRTYADVLNGLHKLVLPETSPEAVQEDVLVKYIYDFSVADATQNKRYGHLRTYFKWLTERRFIKENPLCTVTKPRIKYRLPKVIGKDGLQLIVACMMTDYDHKLNQGLIAKGEIIWRIPLFQFAFLTGMRASELARLRWRDIDLELRLLSILEQKNGHQQTIPLPNRAVQLLASLGTGEGQEFVFHSPKGDRITRSSKRFAERSSHAFRHYRRAVGLPEGICFHSLRHGFCTALANAGKSSYIIKTAARHRDISTSLRYVHISHRNLLTELDDVFE